MGSQTVAVYCRCAHGSAMTSVQLSNYMLGPNKSPSLKFSIGSSKILLLFYVYITNHLHFVHKNIVRQRTKFNYFGSQLAISRNMLNISTGKYLGIILNHIKNTSIFENVHPFILLHSASPEPINDCPGIMVKIELEVS